MEDNKKTKKLDNKNAHGKVIFILIGFLLSCACTVFGILCISHANIGFFTRNSLLLSIIFGLLFIALYGIFILLAVKNKEAWAKAIITLLIFISFCLVVCFILIKTGFFKVIKDTESLQHYLENRGAWMPVLYILLQYLQVVVLPIPTVVSTVAGVALFGTFPTIIYSLIGIILGSLTAFFIGRKLGHTAVSWMVGEDNLKKWQSKLKGKDNFVITLMFLLPLFPDDILCFIAGLSSMSVKYFIGMVIICRIISVTTTCYSIDIIPLTTWWGLLIWGVLIVLLIVGFILVYKNMEKIQHFFCNIVKKFQRKNK